MKSCTIFSILILCFICATASSSSSSTTKQSLTKIGAREYIDGNTGELYVPTPMGLMLKRCVHRVPNGARLTRMNDGQVLVQTSTMNFHSILPLCNKNNDSNSDIKSIISRVAIQNQQTTSGGPFPPDYEGWLAYTAYNYKGGLTSFLGDFSVPASPSSDPDVLYLFTGLQNIDWIPIVDPEPSTPFDIIQPVLQYPGDGGDYWSVKSWYVTLDVGAIASDEIPLESGDVIFGNMTKVNKDEWYVGSTSIQKQKTTAIHVANSRLASQPWAYVTLECYGCSGCSTFPDNSPCNFTNLALYDNSKLVEADWLVNPKPSHNHECNEKPIVNSPEQVVIQF